MLRKEEESQQREWHTKTWSWENPAGLRAGGTGAKASPRVGVGDVLAKEVLVGGVTWPTWQGEWVGVLLTCRAWDLGSVFGRREPSGVSEQQWRMGL